MSIKTNFEIDRLNIYNNSIHNSKIKSYIQNNLATMNKVNSNISFLLLERKIINETFRDRVSGDAGSILANGDNVIVVNYGVLALFNSIRLETISDKNN